MPTKASPSKTVTRMEREHQKGRVALMVLLDKDDAKDLEHLVKKERLSKSDVVRRLIRNAAH